MAFTKKLRTENLHSYIVALSCGPCAEVHETEGGVSLRFTRTELTEVQFTSLLDGLNEVATDLYGKPIPAKHTKPKAAPKAKSEKKKAA